MRNLFILIWKNQFFLLFIFLEIISIILVSKNYTYHGTVAQSVTSDISGNIFSSYSSVTDYFNLKEDNLLLANENSILHNSLKSSFLVSDTQYVYRDSLYQFIPAKIVSNSISKRNNFILVNKGSKHGIEKEMGVISTTGIAGIVVGVSPNYATIMSMLHQNMLISARIKKSQQLVNVIWDNNNYEYGTVIDIPSHITLLQGDTIITSGNSLIFPQDIAIGTIEMHNKDNTKKLSKATLKFTTNFGTLKHVYIIKNLMKTEQDSLINTITN